MGRTTNHAVVVIAIDNIIISLHGRNELGYACRKKEKNSWCCHDGPCAGYCEELRGHGSGSTTEGRLTI
eukprot:scaffold18149_cov61-Skeletonema_dohrnii-CCMP3373.AAC.1